VTTLNGRRIRVPRDLSWAFTLLASSPDILSHAFIQYSFHVRRRRWRFRRRYDKPYKFVLPTLLDANYYSAWELYADKSDMEQRGPFLLVSYEVRDEERLCRAEWVGSEFAVELLERAGRHDLAYLLREWDTVDVRVADWEHYRTCPLCNSPKLFVYHSDCPNSPVFVLFNMRESMMNR
jgi:hypothetical protein